MTAGKERACFPFTVRCLPIILTMKKTMIFAAALLALTLSACQKEDNPVVQGSEYVSEESSEMESIGDMREQQIADAEAALQDMQ